MTLPPGLCAALSRTLLPETALSIRSPELAQHFTSDEVAFDIPVQFTMQVLPNRSGSTIRVLYGEPQVGDKDELEPLFRGASLEALGRLAEMLEIEHKE